MIQPMDDYLVHQTPWPIQYAASSDPRFFDRFYLNFHFLDESVCVLTGLGTYPNNNSMDGFVCAVTNDVPIQSNARFFRPLNDESNGRAHMEVGPLSFEVVEPLKRWHLRLAPNSFG